MIMQQVVIGLCIALFGYLCGSLPFSLWITKFVKGVDVRDAGSGHATTTNTIRQAGWVAGALVLVLDIAKGYIPVSIAMKYSSLPWVLPLTLGLVVSGHCWPIFAQFRGGMGLSAAGGGLLAISLIPALVSMAVLIFLTLVIKHSARAALFTGLVLGPLYFILGQRGSVLMAAFAAGIVLAVRFFSDWKREYRELWLDRENPQP
jgi:glycerol-3-phosphate acyltransferase PlsY